MFLIAPIIPISILVIARPASKTTTSCRNREVWPRNHSRSSLAG